MATLRFGRGTREVLKSGVHYLLAFAYGSRRVAAWTFVTDSTLAIFFNSPPQVAISEMMGDFPCGEALFEAETAIEFERVVSLGLPEPPASALPELMSFLLISPMSEPPIQAKEHVTAPNMLILICGMLLSLYTVMRPQLNTYSSTVCCHDLQNELHSVANC
jgi:hypothetical protein